MTAGALRRAQRRAHLAAGAVLLAYVYAPLGSDLESIVRFGVFPILVLSGTAMWQAARVRRAIKVVNNRAPRLWAQTMRDGKGE